MTDTSAPLLGAKDLQRLANDAAADGKCPDCSALVCPGWESLPGGFESGKLRRIGTLRRPGEEEPTLLEHHPGGTHAWSADAPIAPAFFPYNRCDVWQCASCARPFLRYTEYGGYYQEDRIRAVSSELVVDPAAA